MKKPDFVNLVQRRIKKLNWSMARLDREAGLSIGESRRFLSRERTVTHPKLEKILFAVGLTVRQAR